MKRYKYEACIITDNRMLNESGFLLALNELDAFEKLIQLYPELIKERSYVSYESEVG